MANQDNQAEFQALSTGSKLTFTATPSCQKVVKEGNGFIEVQSDLHHPLLKPVLLDHRINGVPTCPAALWADVAITLASHLARGAKQETPRLVFNVTAMTVKSPLTLTGSKQIYRASGHLDLASCSVWIEIFSINDYGKVSAHHAECIVELESCQMWRQDWQRGYRIIKERVNALHDCSPSDDINKVASHVAYKLMQNSIDYGAPYQGMEVVAYDETDNEASARLCLREQAVDKLQLSPYHIETIFQVAGFAVHADPELDLKSNNFINYGWYSLRISKPLEDNVIYHSYVNMQDTGKGFAMGDLYILEGEEIIGAVQGVRIQYVPKRLDASQGTSDVSTAETQSSINSSSKETTTALSSFSATDEETKAMSALSIVAKEIGIRIGELSLDDAFDDLGLGSLLSLTITNCLREELGIEVDSSLFATCPTVKHLVEFITEASVSVAQPTPIPSSSASFTCSTAASSSAPSSSAASHSNTESDSGSIPSTTPSSVASSDNGDYEDNDITKHDKQPRIPPSMPVQIRALIADEAGVEAHKIDGSTTLAELGWDSLLAVTLASRLREYLHRNDITPVLFADESTTCDDVARALLGTATGTTDCSHGPSHVTEWTVGRVH